MEFKKKPVENQVPPFLNACLQKMKTAGLPGIVRRSFAYYYRQLYHGERGIIAEESIYPVESLSDVEDFSQRLRVSGEKAISKVVQIKLNGGLGTSMGLEIAKSLLPVKKDLSFLDILARQAIAMNVPLVLMNSMRTRNDSLAVLNTYALPQADLPRDFMQNKIPKVLAADLSPAAWPQDPGLEWNPPGHGDFYPAMLTTGILDILLDHGYEFAFVSNADNLGAVMDPGILGYFTENRLSFLMEVTERTAADRKGGHLARHKDGSLILRERAQTGPEDMEAFQDIRRHKYFNTNNLWIHLPDLAALLEEKKGVLGLSMIRNLKNIDPRDPESPQVYQLETAIGSAIEIFDRADAVRVSRERFAPVKTTNDLLAVRSNNFILTPDYRVIPNPDRSLAPIAISLDPAYYRLIDDFESRFPKGPPDLLWCESLEVEGDIEFSRVLELKGRVKLVNPNPAPVRLKSSAISGTVTLD